MQDSIVNLKNESSVLFQDALTEVLREGAQKLLKSAVEQELESFLSSYSERRDEAGLLQVVRNGYLPKRSIQTGLGDIEIQVPRTRDRSGSGLTFTSALLPPYLKRTKSLEELVPWLYLKGISTGDFQEALSALLGPHAQGLSSSTICRLKEAWQREYEDWQQQDLSGKRYVYFYVDGVYLEARFEQKQCLLVIIGVDATGKKELVALHGGFRESELSWKEVLLDLKRRGLQEGPELSIGDGALGFWKALKQVYGQSRCQRCWVHKTANVLNALPKKIQPQAKSAVHQIWMAATKQDALKAFDQFLETYGEKYPKAAHCLEKDREVLLTFYDFPATHWQHIRTTNPIESVFATVKLRTHKTRGCLSLKTGEAMTFKLIQSASKNWIRLRGSQHVAEIIQGIPFKDGYPRQQKEMEKCAA